MASLTVDVALVLPEPMRRAAVDAGRLAADRMDRGGSPSWFRLGEPFPGVVAGPCEPHVSLFMLCVDDSEAPGIVSTVRQVSRDQPLLVVRGEEYRHNPFGAPELYFRKDPAWEELQLAVVDAVEPLRAGRLRDVDPAGADIAELVRVLPPEDPRRRQLEEFGYDEVAAAGRGGIDRFNPHITLAWPRESEPAVSLDGLPEPSTFDGELRELAVFGMSPFGTCTREFGRWELVEATE